MQKQVATLTELAQALDDGVLFFDLASEHSHEAACIQLFQQIRRLKASIAAELRDGALGIGLPLDAGGDWLMGYRRACADLPAKLASAPEPAVIAALEAQEVRILRAFRDAIRHDRPPYVRELAATFLPEVEQARDCLHALHRAVAH